MSQASASVVTTKRQKALLTMKGYSSNWDCTRSNEEIQDKTELEEDERSPSCLDSLRSYITKCFTGTTSGNPALQLPVPSKDVAEKHMPSQAASKIAVLRPDKTGKYPCGQCSKTFSCIDPYIFHIQECHKAETPSDLLVSHYRSNNPEVKTVDRTSTPRVDTANLHSLTTLPHTVASSVASDKTLVKALHPGCFDQIAACKQTSQTIEVADAILNNSIDAVLSIEFCFATSKGVRSCRVLVLTQSDTVRLLQVPGPEIGLVLLFGENHRYNPYKYMEAIVQECEALFQSSDAVITTQVIRTVLAAVVRGRPNGISTKECFHFVYQVTLRDNANVTSLNTTFISGFANHLYENRVDIFAQGSGPAKVFEGLLTYTLKRRNPRPHMNTASTTIPVLVNGLVSAEYWNLQKRASIIIIESQKHGNLKRIHAETTEDNELYYTTKRVFRGSHEATCTPEIPSYEAKDGCYLYPESDPTTFTEHLHEYTGNLWTISR
ncbi:hypothetical protein ST47_g2226 [Ascochyta rabiei]|uniref:Uncharacterized protein n=1 Tax=Didymella rabiei TaxID=5454 RepID=A0A163JND6_DIDRA|nr:hypothetical protein ST47_g2226 [Ascochyta rabiei]